MAVIAPMDGQASSATRRALRDILVRTAPSPVSVKMVPAVILSVGAAVVHRGSVGIYVRMAALRASTGSSAIKSVTVPITGAAIGPMEPVCVIQDSMDASATSPVPSGHLDQAVLRNVSVSSRTLWSVTVAMAPVSVNLVTMATLAKKNVTQVLMGAAAPRSAPVLKECHVIM